MVSAQDAQANIDGEGRVIGRDARAGAAARAPNLGDAGAQVPGGEGARLDFGRLWGQAATESAARYDAKGEPDIAITDRSAAVDLRDWVAGGPAKERLDLALARDAAFPATLAPRSLSPTGSERGPGDPLGLGLVAGSQGAQHPSTAETAAPPANQLVKTAGSNAWSEELGNRVLWLLGRRENLAELRLNPPELGSLEIRIRQENDTASVSFIVQNGSAREAVEGALPRLRELFGEAGLALQHVDVAERQAGGRSEGEAESAGAGKGGATGEEVDGKDAPRASIPNSRGLLDTYV